MIILNCKELSDNMYEAGLILGTLAGLESAGKTKNECLTLLPSLVKPMLDPSYDLSLEGIKGGDMAYQAIYNAFVHPEDPSADPFDVAKSAIIDYKAGLARPMTSTDIEFEI